MGKGYNRKLLEQGFKQGVEHGIRYKWSKPWYRSRTIWMSVLLAVLTVIESRFNLVFAASDSTAVLVTGTTISSIVAALRVITSGGVTVRKGSYQ